MSFEFRPARREAIGLLFGLAGSTGSGKTFSALRLAKGLAGDRRFCVIDTENGRALHYADQFEFDHGDLTAPFTPARYTEAIKAADAAGYPVIVVDSASHEHAGDGGLLDMHEVDLQRMAGDDWKRRESCSMAAWVQPKLAHKRFVNQLLQLKAHIILCFRAEEKVEMGKENGKTVIRPKRSLVGLDGWIPIAEKNLPYELTLSFLFTADRPGVPKPIKLEDQHRLLIPLDQPLSEQAGVALGEWAQGAANEVDELVGEMVTELFDCADQLDRRAEVTAAVQKNRRRHARAPEKHVEWLAAQLAKARDAIGAKAEAEADVDWRDELPAEDDPRDELAPTGLRGVS
jgi:hypothetical protein